MHEGHERLVMVEEEQEEEEERGWERRRGIGSRLPLQDTRKILGFLFILEVLVSSR